MPHCAPLTSPSVSSQCNFQAQAQAALASNLSIFSCLLCPGSGPAPPASTVPRACVCEGPPVVHYYFVLSSLRRSKQPHCPLQTAQKETSALVPQSPRHPRLLPFFGVPGACPPAQLRPTSPGLWFLDPSTCILPPICGVICFWPIVHSRMIARQQEVRSVSVYSFAAHTPSIAHAPA